MKRYIILPLALCLSIMPANTITMNAALAPAKEAEVEVISSGLNVRTGPGTQYKITTEVLQGVRMEVLGILDGWYLIQLNDGTVGLVFNQYVKVTALHDQGAVAEGSGEEGLSDPIFEGSDSEILFGLANASRIENGLPPFTWDEFLNSIAQLKAEDMVQNNYFDHNSPTYGTPFKMLKEMGVEYNGASENLLSNLSMETAHEVLMGSPAHRGNILSPRFNKMGVGVAESSRYGKIIVQLFIEE